MPNRIEHEISVAAIDDTRKSLWAEILGWRRSDGAWEGRLSNSALSTATAISAMSFWIRNQTGEAVSELVEQTGRQIDAGFRWLRPLQNEDGGWGDTTASYSNISTTLLVIAAIHAAEVQEDWSPELDLAWEYINGQGGIDGVRRRYGADKTFSVPILASAAMSGIVPWREVGVLPFEAACVPQSWYNLVQMPVVSYAVPALVAIGQVKFVHDPPWNPIARLIRKMAFVRATAVLQRMQPESGGYLEAVPLTSFVTMALCCSGRADHPVATEGVRFLLDSFRPEGSWPIDTNLATWNTTLTINSLAADWPDDMRKPDTWRTTLKWLMDCQTKQHHPFTGAAPGAWGWTDLTGSVPDADDTPGAMLTLKHLSREVELDSAAKSEMQSAALRGAGWLLDLQNRDGGWPTFCRGWGRFPFDRSGADITAHVIRGLNTWREQGDAKKIDAAIGRGFRFMESKQNPDGSWFPLWFGNQDVADENNPVYGTSRVLMAWRDTGCMNEAAAVRGLEWLLENQRANGSWGGGISVGDANDGAGEGTVEETSLAVDILCDAAFDPGLELDFANQIRKQAMVGGRWLVDAIDRKEHNISRPIGFYFAKLWYDEQHYPFVFSLAALGKLGKLVRQNRANDSTKLRTKPDR